MTIWPPDFAGSLDNGWIKVEPFGKRQYYINGRAVPTWYGKLALRWLWLWRR